MIQLYYRGFIIIFSFSSIETNSLYKFNTWNIRGINYLLICGISSDFKNRTKIERGIASAWSKKTLTAEMYTDLHIAWSQSSSFLSFKHQFLYSLFAFGYFTCSLLPIHLLGPLRVVQINPGQSQLDPNNIMKQFHIGINREHEYV